VELTTEPLQLLLGISKLNADGSVPDEPKDARVIDQDEDGDPGVSIAVGPGRVFIGMAATMTLEGDWQRQTGELSGSADLATDSATYGDSIWLYDARKAAAEEEAAHDYEYSATFLLTPSDEELSCQALDAD